MATVNKSNAVPTVTEAKCDAADMFRHVITMGKAARTAALDLCYSAACYIILVSHFKGAKDTGYMTRSDAVEYLRKQIKAQADVQGGMLDIYIRNASTLAGALTGSAKMFAPVLQRMGLATDPEAMVSLLSDWCNQHMTDPAARRQIDSLSALSEALGYSTGRKRTNPGLTADKAPERAANAIKAIEKIVTEGDKAGHKVSETKVATAVIAQVGKPIVYAVEAVKRLTDEAELRAVEDAIAAHRKTLAKLAEKAKANVQQTHAEQHAATVKRNRDATRASKRRAVQQTQA